MQLLVGETHAVDRKLGILPINQCTLQRIPRKPECFFAILAGQDAEFGLRLPRAYLRFIDPDRERGIVLAYCRGPILPHLLDYMIVGLQVSFDPLVYIKPFQL